MTQRDRILTVENIPILAIAILALVAFYQQYQVDQLFDEVEWLRSYIDRCCHANR